MTYLLAVIGTRETTEDEVEAVVEHHLRHPAFWSSTKHDAWARGSRVVAKVAGVRQLVLTGTLDCTAPAHDPLEADGQVWEWRYAMRWDERPPHVVAAHDLGTPFVQVRQAKKISATDFERAFRALHGRSPTRQLG